jgi:hypothetical protein
MVPGQERKSIFMMNFHDKKTKQTISVVIVVILIIAMVVPMCLSVVYS